jgi:hypothetical protein
VSYRHVQRLAAVRAEYEAAGLALEYLQQTWHQLGGRGRRGSVEFPHIREAALNLEITYLIRIFTEFESLLNRHLAERYPALRMPRTAEALINRVALRERIPDPIRAAAQAVREYRNEVVHRRAALGFAPTIEAASAALNRFLARLP